MERRAAYDKGYFGAIGSFFYASSTFANHEDFRFGSAFVSSQFFVGQERNVRRSHFSVYVFTSRTSASTLFVHGSFEAFHVDSEAGFAGDFLRQFPRESVRIIQFEHVGARQYANAVFFMRSEHTGQQFQALFQGLVETVFFISHNAFDEVFLFN